MLRKEQIKKDFSPLPQFHSAYIFQVASNQGIGKGTIAPPCEEFILITF